MKIIRTSGLVIPRTYEKEDFYQNIKNHLTRKVYGYNRSDFSIYEFYVEGPNVLLIPRFFPIHKFNAEFEIIDKIPDGKDIDITHNISKLRDELQENVVNYMRRNKNGLIQAPPGSGKTVMAIYTIGEKKKKTFILVHKDYLVQQWRNRVLEFTNLKEDDVVILKSSTFRENLDKSIVVCTDQMYSSLLRRCRTDFFIELNKANFGLFIADEVHTSVGAPTFAECSIHLPAKIVYGLSATPSRQDGNSDIIEYHLGKIFIPEGNASVMKAKINIILADFGIMKKSGGWICWGGQFQRSRYLQLLRKSDLLINLLIAIINKLYKENRKMIVMSERLNFIDLIFNKINHLDKGIFAGTFAKDDDLRKGITIATPGKIRDGVDIPEKDCLITTSPISNIEQLIGRILRIKEGKKEPVLIDFVDIGCSDIKGSIHSRLKFYESKNYEIKFFYVDDLGKISELIKENAIELLKNEG